MSRFAVKLVMVLGLLMGIAGCGGGSSSTSTATVVSAVSGVAQGPVLSGSVKIQEVDSSLTPVSGTLVSKTMTGLGIFSATPSKYMDLNATGNYFDELLNVTSTGPVTLSSYAINSDASLNINILTTLAYQRIKTLINKAGSLTQGNFLAARLQAEKEVLNFFHIRDPFLDQYGNVINFGSMDMAKGGNTKYGDANNFMAAISSLFEFNNSFDKLSTLITGFQSDIQDNGCINTNIGTTLINNASSVVGVNTTALATNLSAEYTPVTFLPTDISNWLDQDKDGVIGKYKLSVAQAASGTQSTFQSYQVGVADNNESYSIINDPASNDPNASATITNSTTGMTASIGSLLPLTVHTGDTIIVTRTPALEHGSSMAYLQSTATKPCSIDTRFDTGSKQNVARFEFNPFAPEGSLTTARTSPTVTLLQDGRVLIAGGMVAGAASKLVELYDPAQTNNKWSVLKTMNVARVGHTATLLNDGQVLVVGGDGGDKASPTAGTAELYNPTTGIWTALTANSKSNTYSPVYGHVYHTATLLKNTGQVLVVGGNLFAASNVLPTNTSAEIYTPASGVLAGASTGTWSIHNMNSLALRYNHTATVLNDGKVLIAGGFNGNIPVSSAELFNSATNTWTTVGSSVAARYKHSATLLNDGRVLITGGATTGAAAITSAELYDTVLKTWTATKFPLGNARFNHVAQLLDDGNVLIAGGTTNNNSLNNIGLVSGAELYYPATDSFIANGKLTYPRAAFGAVMLNTGKVFMAGGFGVTAAETFK